MTTPKSIAQGTLSIGGKDIACHVLDNGKRVVSKSGMLGGLTVTKGRDLNRYLERIPSKYVEMYGLDDRNQGIEFELNGQTIMGYDSSQFVALCKAYSRAQIDGALHHKQKPIADMSTQVMFALADVGIVALIDEATGYQADRSTDFLRRLIERSIRDEATHWEETFHSSLARSMAPLWGVAYVDGAHPRELKNAYGKIYDILLGKDVTAEMRRRNPGTEKSKRHQWLKPEARKLLQEDLRVVEMIATQSRSKNDFWSRLMAHFRKLPLQLGF